MTVNLPQPRPALRRAPDSDVHPALVIPLQSAPRPSAPAEPDIPPTARTAPEPIPVPAPDKTKEAKKSGKGKSSAKAKAKAKAKKRKKRERAERSAKPTPLTRFQGAGRATSDAVLFEPDRRVPLSVLVPKAIRDEIRDVARLSGATQDELVSELLSAGLSDPRRW